jgi:hypothetical protein
MMKTTLHLHRPRETPMASPIRLGSGPVRSSTLRLGIALSVVGALLTLVLETVVDVPVIAILVPVVIVGFALSWHACGRPLAGERSDQSPDQSRDGVTPGPPG